MADAADLTDRARRSADPPGVALVLDRIAERDPDARERLVADPALADAAIAVIAASRWLGRLVASDARALEVLASLDRRVPVDDVSDPGSLAHWRELEVLRIAARDLTGRDDLIPTMAAVTAMAATVCATALRLAGADGLAVIAMGKAGGNELNYASDVDVVLVGATGDRAEQEAARRFVDTARAAIRVDVDLRPEGRDGPLVRTLDGYRGHWDRWAEPWERQALLKARTLAGDGDLAREFEASAAAQLWERGFDADAIQQVRSMKARTERHALQHDGREDLKRTPGGIRDIEFAAQLLQLVHGPLDPALRVRGTLPALTALGDGGYVDDLDARWLRASYRFLRRIEHAVQLDRGRQVHSVPTDRIERERLARVLGLRDRPSTSALDEFDAELTACRATVRSIHERVYFRPLLDAFERVDAPLAPDAAAARLAAFGFADADRTRRAIEELTRGLTRSSRLMAQMLPLLLDWLSGAPDPDQGLLALRTLVAAEPRAVAAAFRESPETARRVCVLVGTSPLLVRILDREPQLLSPAELAPVPPGELATTRAAAVARAAEVAPPEVDPATVVRRAVSRARLQVAAADVLDDAPADAVGASLAAVAREAAIAAVAVADPQVPLAVMALGRLAAADLGYASDLDLVFLHGATDDDGRAEATRATEAVRRFLAGRGAADRTYAVDLDLRPGGRSAPVARSLDSLIAHLDRWAEPWERLAYSRLTPLAGDDALAAAALAGSHDLVHRPPTAADLRAIRRVKARSEAERVPPGEDPKFHLKLGPGALTDIELTVDLLLLRHDLVEPSTGRAIAALRDHDVIGDVETDALAAAHTFCARVRNRATLVAGRPRDSLPTGDDLTVLARSLGTSAPRLRDEFLRLTRRARRVVEARFYDR